MDFSILSDQRAAIAPEGPCVADADKSLSNAAFHASVLAAAGLFAAHGIGLGSVVALMLPNQVEFAVAMFAAWRLGAAITPINPALTSVEATHQLRDSHSKLLINLSGEVVATDITTLPASALAHGRRHDAAPVVDADALALLIYTSGTTGRPKGVMLDHANIDAMTQMGLQALQISERDHCLLILPLFHVNGIVVSILATLRGGGHVTICKRFDSNVFFADVERLRPTFVSGVPTIFSMLNALPAEFKPDTSSLRYGICGAAPASADLLADFEARYGFPIIEAYGLSESTCGVTINRPDGMRKAGTVGLPFAGQCIAIADQQGNHLPQGEVGEVLVKGDNIMRGYLGKPEETATTIVDGWLRTGDLGRLDADGYLSIVGRLKDMIIRGGENIYPKEIEDVLYGFSGVVEAAVVGAPNEKLGEIVIAYVALHPTVNATVADIEAHCATLLTRIKQPAALNIMASLPKNAVGKFDKPKLKALWAARAQ
jgi:long-chain acyl-CoA synthetase